MGGKNALLVWDTLFNGFDIHLAAIKLIFLYLIWALVAH